MQVAPVNVWPPSVLGYLLSLPTSLAAFPSHLSSTDDTTLSSSSSSSQPPSLAPRSLCQAQADRTAAEGWRHFGARPPAILGGDGEASCTGLAVSLLNPEPFSCPGPAAGIWDDLSRIAGGAKCLCSEVWLLEGLAIMLMSRCVRELSQRVWV